MTQRVAKDNPVRLPKKAGKQKQIIMKRKSIIIISIVATAMIGVGIFYACKKDAISQKDAIKDHKSMVYYDASLVNRFWNFFT